LQRLGIAQPGTFLTLQPECAQNGQMKTTSALLFSTLLLASCTTISDPGAVTAAAEANSPLARLEEGNRRAASNHSTHPHASSARRGEVAQSQSPFAVIVSCSDSRVPPELLFDQGYGDLFVIRIAGNVVEDTALGSIEYAVEHLGAKLLVVLGHERCGAVKATVDGGEAPGHIGSIVNAIKPADRLLASPTIVLGRRFAPTSPTLRNNFAIRSRSLHRL
jgi:carbonic anhydrase